MSFNIIKQLNADEQEPIASDAEATATTNEPVEMAVETPVETVKEKPVEQKVETGHDE